MSGDLCGDFLMNGARIGIEREILIEHVEHVSRAGAPWQSSHAGELRGRDLGDGKGIIGIAIWRF